jgi:hypothetical protein
MFESAWFLVPLSFCFLPSVALLHVNLLLLIPRESLTHAVGFNGISPNI